MDFNEIITIQRAEKFSNNRTLNLKKMGGGKGVRNLTIKNTGTVDLILEDIYEIVTPGSIFFMNSDLLVANEKFPIRFTEPEAPSGPATKTYESGTKEAIVRYQVDICS